jgi:Ser/Thr protein kinase RdoA (MazF antagonist)
MNRLLPPIDTEAPLPTAGNNAAYHALGPEVVLDAVEGLGFICDGRLLALNSYENRVYQVGREDADPLVAKFYRPERWSDEAILEEHAFSLELGEEEIPVVPPLILAGRTLHRHGPYRFALYPRRGGRTPELDDPSHLEQLGRFLGRLHNLGAARPFLHRPRLSVEHFGEASTEFLLAHHFIPDYLVERYRTLVEDLLGTLRAAFDRLGTVGILRLHGDFHLGNILWRDNAPQVVDFDDARMGPAVQDLWMLLAGDGRERSLALADLLEGYTQFRDFDVRELNLIEPLRTLRLMHYAAWIARRWSDPAFPRAFPWFGSPRYWEEHLLTLGEQVDALAEPPLAWV